MRLAPKLWLLGMAIVVMLGGCAGTPLPTPTPLGRAASATPAATQPPRASATPADTAEPTAEQAIDLNAPNLFAYITPEGGVALALPSGEQRVIWDGVQGAATGISWAHDGQRLAFVARRRLYIWSTEHQAPQAQLDHVAPPLSWTLDSQTIAAATGEEGFEDTLVLVNILADERRTLGKGANPHFAPGGQRVLLASTPPEPALPMREGPAASPMLWTSLDQTPLVLESAYNLMDWSRVAWSDDGSLAAVSNLLLRADGQIEQELGPPLNAAQAGPESRHAIANGISADGHWVAIATLAIGGNEQEPGGGKQTDLAVLDRLSGERRAVWQSDRETGHGYSWQLSPVIWSPDSRTLSFTGAGTTLGSDPIHGAALWLGTADGSELAPLPGSEGATGTPLFAPDGSFLLFTVGRESPEIWGWLVGGAEPPQRIVAGSAPAWRP